MGEARAKENAAVEAAVATAKQESASLKPEQAAVMLAVQRICSAVMVECAQLANTYGQADAAKEISGMIEYGNKFALRYLQEAQRAIVVPKVNLVQP